MREYSFTELKSFQNIIFPLINSDASLHLQFICLSVFTFIVDGFLSKIKYVEIVLSTSNFAQGYMKKQGIV